MQKDDISYTSLMETISVKKDVLISWKEKKANGDYVWGPSLAEYLRLTQSDDYLGAFKILSKTHRDDLIVDCLLHIDRLIEEIDRRFPQSELRLCLSILFDPMMMKDKQKQSNDATYGRSELDYLRRKYDRLSNFDSRHVQMEWESFRPLVTNFMSVNSSRQSPASFWKDFIQLKSTKTDQFCEQLKNILTLLCIYLIAPLNSAECERGYSAANRVQTATRSRITIETLGCLLTVRLLLTDGVRG